MADNDKQRPIEDVITTTVSDLLRRNISSTEIAQETGITRQLIDNYRNNLSQLNRMSLKNITPLYELELTLREEDKRMKKIFNVMIARPTPGGVPVEPIATFSSLGDAEEFSRKEIKNLPKVQEELRKIGPQHVFQFGGYLYVDSWNLIIEALIQKDGKLEDDYVIHVAEIREDDIRVTLDE